MWQPTHAELMSAIAFVLSEEEIHSDAFFIHGPPMEDDKFEKIELKIASNFYKRGYASKILLNGITHRECCDSKLNYKGFERWKETLVSFGVKENDIAIFKSAKHTGTESTNMLLFAKKNDWKTVTIMSHPIHQLRCFLTAIGIMKSTGFFLKVYNRTFPLQRSDWIRDLTKIVLGGNTVMGSNDISGNMQDHINEEYKRIIFYAQDPKVVGKHFTRHATIPEMFEYVKMREGI